VKSGGVVLSRRQVVVALAGLAAALSTTSLTPLAWAKDAAPEAFSFDALTERMRALASQPAPTDEAPLPAVLKSLDYDAYRLIQARDERAVALSSGFGYFI
jgi:glucan biosynthesis protein